MHAMVSTPAGADGWTVGGFWITLVGAVVGLLALGFAVAIFSWTRRDHADRHGEILDALKNAQSALAEVISGSQPTSTDLSELGDARADVLRSRLAPGEVVVRVARAGLGKGNHPWHAVTSHGRTLQVYTGGRRGGVHVQELS